MRVRACITLVFLMLVAGCQVGPVENPGGDVTGTPTPATTSALPTASASRPTTITDVRAVVEVPTNICQPPGVAGNCWLPFYPQPALKGTALNQSKMCSNNSTDQSSCWPQPGTEVKAVCTIKDGGDRLWYGVRVPQEQVKSGRPQDAKPVPGSTDLLGYAAATYMRVLEPEALKTLPDCSTLT